MHTCHGLNHLARLTGLCLVITLLGGVLGCAIAPDTRRHDVQPHAAAMDESPAPTLAGTSEREPSREPGISREEDSHLRPSAPAVLEAQAMPDGAVLTWKGAGDDRIVYYRVYRRVSDTTPWRLIDRVPAKGDNRDPYAFRDESAERDGAWCYGVSSVDGYGNESEITERCVVTS